MPDGTGGIATGLYWVATGKLPIEDLDEESKDPKLNQDDDDPLVQKDRKG